MDGRITLCVKRLLVDAHIAAEDNMASFQVYNEGHGGWQALLYGLFVPVHSNSVVISLTPGPNCPDYLAVNAAEAARAYHPTKRGVKNLLYRDYLLNQGFLSS